MLRLHLPGRPTEPLALLDVAAGAAIDHPVPEDSELAGAVWIDLFHPTSDEVAAAERVLQLELPTKAEMSEIEASSRVYRDGVAQVMNLLLVVGVDSGTPAAAPVSLVLTPSALVTIRFADPQAFRSLDASCTREAPGESPVRMLSRLLENIVDRTADILEKMGGEIDQLSSLIFGLDRPDTVRLSTADLQSILRRIGSVQFVLNKVHESLVTQMRAISFLSISPTENGMGAAGRKEKIVRETLKSLARDIQSLLDNSSYMIQNIGFLLDAAMGRISIEQNAIVKIFSVAAVIFLPPTLVASIYGMNFENMPELGLELGYPMALAMMLLSAILPYLWFRKKGWL